jgi:dTDP-4-dehydrorhamnose 3,5-epimerase-like enzyme
VNPEDIVPEFRGEAKDYARATPIEGVRILPLTRFTDDRGFFM